MDLDLTTKRLLIFDADGTLRRCTVPGQPCPNKPDEWELIPGVREKIGLLPSGMSFAIVSNQGGVGLGIMSEEIALEMLKSLAESAFVMVRPANVPVIVLMCPHAPKAGCTCRKPEPLMLNQAMQKFGALPSETLYVGDMASDSEAAERAGVDFMWAQSFFCGWIRCAMCCDWNPPSGIRFVTQHDGEPRAMCRACRTSERDEARYT